MVLGVPMGVGINRGPNSPLKRVRTDVVGVRVGESGEEVGAIGDLEGDDWSLSSSDLVEEEEGEYLEGEDEAREALGSLLVLEGILRLGRKGFEGAQTSGVPLFNILTLPPPSPTPLASQQPEQPPACEASPPRAQAQQAENSVASYFGSRPILREGGLESQAGDGSKYWW